MKKEFELKLLESKEDLYKAFYNDFYENIVDKDNFGRAIRMFEKGMIPYDIATGKDPINVAELRHKVATDMWTERIDRLAKVKAAMEEQRKIVDYYNGCKALKYPWKPKNGVQDIVFVKDGHLVAFAHFEPKQGGIYSADNEVMPNFKWTPYKWLGRLRKMNKAFYRDVKKAAFASPKEWFDFNIK
jgi:hypothetical protein